MFFRLSLFSAVFLLASCVTPSFNSPIESITSEQLESYWYFDGYRESRGVKLIGSSMGCYQVLPLRITEALGIEAAETLSITFVIDSIGNTYEHSVSLGTPNATVNELIVSVLAERFKMIAVKKNTAKTPVRVTEEFALFASGKYCLPYSNPEQLMETEGRDIWAEERYF